MQTMKMTLDNYIITVNTLIAAGLSSLIAFLSKKLSISIPTWEKLTSYECGFEPFGDARKLSVVGFFLVAMLFLLFDLEVVLLLPWAKQFLHTGMFVYSCVVIYILLLGTGFIYETDKGVLGLSIVLICSAWISIGGWQKPDIIWEQVVMLYKQTIGENGLWPDWPRWYQWPFYEWRIDPITNQKVFRTRDWAVPYLYGERLMETLKNPEIARTTPGFWYNFGWWVRFIEMYLPSVLEYFWDAFVDWSLSLLGPWKGVHYIAWSVLPLVVEGLAWCWNVIACDWLGFIAPLREGEYRISIYDIENRRIDSLILGDYYLTVGPRGKLDLKLVVPWYLRHRAPESLQYASDGSVILSSMANNVLAQNPPGRVILPWTHVEEESEIESYEEWEDRVNETIIGSMAAILFVLVLYILGLEACPEEAFKKSWIHTPMSHYPTPDTGYDLFEDFRPARRWELDRISQFFYNLHPKAPTRKLISREDYVVHGTTLDRYANWPISWN